MSGVSGNPGAAGPRKPGAVPLQRTGRQIAASARAAVKRQEAEDLAVQETELDAVAARTAQIANLLIAGHTFDSIGRAVGCSGAEVEKMIAADTGRYVRSQASLRIWVRNWISAKYAAMIDTDWDAATDNNRPDMLDHQDRVDRFLRSMARLHGADAPTQTEVKVEAAPESIERMVAALAAQRGQGYDADIFDIDEDDITEVAHENHSSALAALEAASERVERPVEGEVEETL